MSRTPLDRFLSIFGEVHPGEGRRVVLLTLNVLLALFAYYVVKTVREPLILTSGGAEWKSYASAAQALLLMGLVPLYSLLSHTVDRLRLVAGVLVFFGLCIQGFWVAGRLEVPYVGFAFYVWVGIFSLALIAQFWSVANDLYTEGAGKRLFPIIAIGATVGSAVGSKVAGWLFDQGLGPFSLLQVAFGVLVVHGLLYLGVDRSAVREGDDDAEGEALDGPGGFSLVLANPYLRTLAGVLVLANLANTIGEYILSVKVVEAAEAAVAAGAAESADAFIGAWYGDFFFWVNIATIAIQAFVVSRLVKYGGIRAAVLALPIVALGVYGALALGAGLTTFRWLKTAENSTDYSVMNTAKAMLWLPTSREEKYKAKQAIDTFFVRLGDVFAAVAVFVGTTWLSLTTTGFALTNLGVLVGVIAAAVVLLRQHRRLSDDDDASDDLPDAGGPGANEEPGAQAEDGAA